MTLVVVTRYVVPQAEGADFRERAREALDALRGQTGCRRGHVGRSMDEPTAYEALVEGGPDGLVDMVSDRAE